MSKTKKLFCTGGALLCILAVTACSTTRTPGATLASPLAASELPLSMIEASMRTELAATAAVIVRDSGTLHLRYPVRLAFAADQNAVLPAFAVLLEALARTLRAHAGVVAEVAVFTDAIGSEAFNSSQSQQRAESISAWLRERGVAARRLSLRAGGEATPLRAENTPEGRDLNRRVELSLSVLSS